jgi:hypothetical protein
VAELKVAASGLRLTKAGHRFVENLLLRVGKTRLAIEWLRRRRGKDLHTPAFNHSRNGGSELRHCTAPTF